MGEQTDLHPELADQIGELLESHTESASLTVALDLTPICNRLGGQTGSKSSITPESMVRAHLLRKIRGMQFLNDLPKYFEDHPDYAVAFGFVDENDTVDVPSRSAFSRWWNHYLPEDVVEIIEDLADRIIEQAHQQGQPLDCRPLEPEDVQATSQRTKSRVKKEMTHEVAEKMAQYVYPQLGLKRAENTKYADEEFFRLLLHMAQTDDFAANGSDTLTEIFDDDKEAPDGDTLQYHLKKFDPNEIEAMSEDASDMLFELARKMGLFDDACNIAFDTTPVPFYGDTETEGVSDIKPTQGTAYGYEFMTVSVVSENGKRFMLDFALVETREDIMDTLGEMLERVREYVTVDTALMDRGFYGVLMLNELKEIFGDTRFVVRAIQSQKTGRLLDEADGDVAVELDDEMERSRPPYEKTTVHRFIVPSDGDDDDDEYISFVTNRPVTKTSAVELAALYPDRWGIETAHRVSKGYMGKNKSTSLVVRLFYFMFAMLFYNVWVLTNAVVRESLGIPKEKSPPVTAKYLATVLRGLREGIT